MAAPKQSRAVKQKVHSRSWLCEECILVFDVHKVLRKTPICPECGDRIAVRRYEGARNGDGRKSGKGAKIRWKPEEMTLLEACMDGNELPYRVAILIGRSTNSVAKKLARMRRGRERTDTQLST